MALILGLTGGIASGKSTVAKMFQERGAYIIDADQIAREVVEPGEEGWHRVRERFGAKVFRPDGTLDRAALRKIVFNDEGARQDLNSLLHPLIRSRMRDKSRQLASQFPQGIIILDIPLLFESKLTHLVEKVIVVYIPEPMQLERLIARSGLTEEEAQKMVQAQLPIEEKKARADIIIDNSGSITETERQVDHLWKWLASKSGFAQQ